MGRPRRKYRKDPITYDSRETRTVFGLLSILLSLTLFIAVLAESATPNFFTEVRRLFGQTTIFAAIYFFNFGLFCFESRLPFTSKSSIIAQTILLVLIPAFATSLNRSKEYALASASQGLSGGEIGFFVSYRLFEDSLVFAQYTPLILGIAILIFAPIALSMSVSRLIEYLERIIKWLWNGIRTLFAHREREEDTEKDLIPESASRFGDFNKKQMKQDREIPLPRHQDDQPQPTYGDLPHRPSASETTNVSISEKEIGEEGLSQSQLSYPNWKLPPSTLLEPYRKSKPNDADKERNADIIETTLASFNVDAEVVDAFVGPSVMRYALNLRLGTKVQKVENLAPNLALALGVDSQAIRIETIPGTSFLGIEVPRHNRDSVKIRELVEATEMQDPKKKLPVTVGKNIDGNAVIADIQKMPHLLIAGATGSGKSVLTNSFIVSLLMKKSPDELRMILVDPKQVELSDYNGIPHLLTPVITDMDKVVNALKWAVNEMERRYTTLAASQVRNIEGYNEKMGFSAMPYIVIVIDEMADMMMTAGKVDAETAIVRLAQKARAVGIHLILATQRPSVNVITGLIKANIPARIGMSVTSNIDSRVILDANGAESLMGRGDLLYKSPDGRPSRLQGSNVTQEEVIRVVNFIKAQVPEVQYITSILESPASAAVDGGAAGGNMSDDDLFEQAVRIIVNYQKGSSSFLQRKLNIGFNRAARLLEEMEEMGIVGPAVGGKPREVLITDADSFLAQINQ